MSRRFRVRVQVINVHVYEVDLDGTADPEVAPPDWLALTRDLEPAEIEYGVETLFGVEESVRGQ